MKIINLSNTGELERVNYGEKYTGAIWRLGKLFGAAKLGFHVEVMDPRTFSCPYHYHEQEEEIVLVLEGEAIVRCNGAFRKVKAGDLIFYSTGPDSVHHMYNHTDKPFKFLALSNESDHEVCYYPDSNKRLDAKTRSITQRGVAVDYFKDEEDPSTYWPEHALRGEV